MPDDLRDAAILDVVEPIAAARTRDWGPEDAAILKRSLSALRGGEPERYARLERIAHRHARALKALRVSDRGLREMPPAAAWRARARRAADVLTAVPAIAGGVIHAMPAFFTHLASRHRSYGASQIAFARITAGFFFLTVTYAAMAFVAARYFDAGPFTVLLLLASSAVLGWIALAWGERMRPAWERFRLARIARRHPGLVERARRGEETLARWVADRLHAPKAAA
jgi:hypothetical protein